MTCLWFDKEAEEAAKYYTSIFKGSKILNTAYYSEVGFEFHQRPKGSVMTVTFEINGHKFMALNGGPIFKFSEATSTVVECESQSEIDHLWGKLTEGGDKSAQQCGWLKDKFGVSWQIVPAMMEKLTSGDQASTDRVMTAMFTMKKMEIAPLVKAYENK